jgi:hypothetical protein
VHAIRYEDEAGPLARTISRFRRLRRHVKVEADSAGNYMSNKSCVSCPPGAGVVTEAGVYAGASYSADLYECQRCPDPHMDMALDR